MKNDIQTMIKNIANNLGNYDEVIKVMSRKENIRYFDNLAVPAWEHDTLSSGLPGICLLFGELMERYPEEEKWAVIANEYLGRIVKNLNEKGIESLSMFSGLTGIGLCVTNISDGFKNYNKLLKTINDYILSTFNEMLSQVVNNHGTHSLYYDVIEGISGIINYLSIFKNEEKYCKTIKNGLNKLVELTNDIDIDGYKVPGWYIPRENQFSEIEKRIYPHGNFNTSLSHGIAGRLVVLSRMYQVGMVVDGQLSAIKKIVEFYLQFRNNDGKREFWKGQLDYKEIVDGKVSNENIVRRDAWCYGNPGICYALISAGKALEDKNIINYAIDIMKKSMKDIRAIFSPTFCHGYAGLYQVLSSTEDLLNKEIFTREKSILKNKILGFYDSSYPFGFRDIEIDESTNKERGYDSVGLLTGVSGICLVLLNSENKSRTLWKKAFVLE